MKKFMFISFIIVFFTKIVAAITVSPAVVEISVSPGTQTNGFYIVKNPLNKKILVKVKAETFSGKNVSKWLQLSPTKFELSSGESKKVKYTVNIPNDTKGEISAKVYFDQLPVKDKNTLGGAAIIPRIGSAFYVSVKGTEIISAQLNKLDIKQTSSKFLLSTEIMNKGNVHLRFYYDIEIYNDKGENILATPKSPLVVVLPGITKNINNVPIKLNKQLLSGKYYVILHLYYGNIMPLTNKMSKLVILEAQE